MPKINFLNIVKRAWLHIQLPMLQFTQIKGLRDFAWQFSVLISIVFMGLLPWLFSASIPFWPLFIAGYLLISAVIYPKAIYPIYVMWMVIASVLGFINTQILLALVFYVIFVPMGWLLRLTKGLQYQQRRPSTLTSYYIKRDTPLDKNHLTKPF